jgi:hypothetical protein
LSLNDEGLNEYREKVFKEVILSHLAAKQYKRRKNAFSILAHMIKTDAAFATVAL